MPRSFSNAVKDSTTSTGPTSFVVSGVAPNGFRTCTAGLTNGASYGMRIDSADQSQWLVGEFSWNAGTSTLSLTAVHASSNGGSNVTFSAGTKTVTHLALANEFSNPVFSAVQELRVAMAANDVNLFNGSYFTKTISGATTLTVSNVPASGTGASFILDLTNGGSATITWWSGVKWAGGTAPTLTASGRDVLGFFTHDGGTTWTGLVLGKDVK